MVRIGMLAPITHGYPPNGYGPWERVTHDLTERLVLDGHDVTLFAAAGSETKANLIETVDAPLASTPWVDRRAAEDRHVDTAMTAARDGTFDVVHSHLHVHALPFADKIPCPLVTTLHGAAWAPAHHDLLRRHAGLPYVSLSDRERAFFPELNYVATIPNGIRVEEFPVGDGSGGYLAFVGRISPEKAPHLAIETARRTGRHLLIAGVIEDQHRRYARDCLRSTGETVDYLGPLDRPELSLLLRDAAALLMPLQWDEPFGLVVVESLASGTPVIAWGRGAMPEIIDDGVTGFIVDDVEGAVNALSKVEELSRADCARVARARFDDATMAAAYAEVYQRVVS
ncbi:MAG: glycosyltransferase family 4 protein [Acidimicrobiia bacterium]